MSGHESFISSVATLPPNEKYPQGLIVTGGNDAKINAYTLESPMPVYTLTGHSGTGMYCTIFSARIFVVVSTFDST